jgi:hypothetical protein
MKLKSIVIIGILVTVPFKDYGGNPDRIGQAGAAQLNMNNWARSSGMGWSAVSSVVGVESMFMNVAGLAKIQKTELLFARTNWLRGSGININSFGFAQNIGGDGVLGVSVMSMNFGEIPITTTNQPDGGIGTYSPSFTNIGIGYSKRFTNSITGGVLVRVFSEALASIKAQGIAFDMGIQYMETSNKKDKAKKNDIKFGISMKNVGPDARYGGDGLSIKFTNPDNGTEQTVALRTAKFNLPALINIGGSYDFRLDKTKDLYFHRLTTALNFTSNAFARNQFTAGFEYGYKNLFMLRTGYAFESGITGYYTRTNAYTGLSAGFTFEVPLNKNKSKSTFGFDYSYRHSNPFSGTHSIGVRLNLDN